MSERLKILATSITVDPGGAIVNEISKTDDADLVYPGIYGGGKIFGSGGVPSGDQQRWIIHTSNAMNQRGTFQAQLFDSLGVLRGMSSIPLGVMLFNSYVKGVQLEATLAAHGTAWFNTEKIEDYKGGQGAPDPWLGMNYNSYNNATNNVALCAGYLLSPANYATGTLVITVAGRFAAGMGLEIWSGIGDNNGNGGFGHFKNTNSPQGRAYKATIEGSGPVEFTIPLLMGSIPDPA